MPIKTVTVYVNGTSVAAQLQADGTYKAILAAPNRSSAYNTYKGAFYGVTVVAENMADTATSVTYTDAGFENLKLYVLEVTAPTISISAPTSGQYLGTATPEIRFTLNDEDYGSGIDISSLIITLDGQTYGNETTGVDWSAITGKTHLGQAYDVVFTPQTALSDGTHTLKVTVSDNDGNTATSETVSFVTDTILPTLSVSNPASNGTYVSNAALTVSGTASDSTSGAPTIKITLNGTNQGAVTLSNGAFSKAVTLEEGNNTIVVTATDKAGKVTTITRTIILDTSAPVIASVNITPNPVNVGANYTVTVTVTG